MRIKYRGRKIFSPKLIVLAIILFGALNLNRASSRIAFRNSGLGENPKSIFAAEAHVPDIKGISVQAEPDPPRPAEDPSFYTLTPRAHRHCTPPFDPTQADPEQLHIVIWVSNQDNPAYANFLLSLNRLGYHNLHMLKPSAAKLQEETMWAMRMSQLLAFFETQSPETLILAVDCYDVLFTQGPEELMRRYALMGARVVSGAEMLCDTTHCRHNSEIREGMVRRAPVGNRYRYINGGTIMGQSRDLIRLYELAMAAMSSGDDDQIGLARVYRAHPELLTLDFNSSLFGVLPPSHDLLDLEWTLGPEDLVPTHTDPESPAWAQIHRRANPDTPAILHFPGMRYMGDVYQLFNPCQCALGSVYNYVGQALLSISEAEAQRRTRDVRVVVSLTSTPARLKTLRPTLWSILNQTLSPAAIYLNVPRGRAPNPPCEVPDFIRSLPVTFFWSPDYGPASKLLPTLRIEREPDTVIVTLDDDMVYKPGLLMDLTRHILAWPRAAFGYAGQMVDTQGYSPVARSADEWRAGLAAVDILESFKGAAYLRGFFDDSIQDIAPVCTHMSDIHISAHLARKWIPRIKLPQSQEACPQPRMKEEGVAILRDENMGGRECDLCAASLLEDFRAMWSDHVTACPVRFELLHLPPLKDFPLGPHYTEDMPVLKCNNGNAFQIGRGTTQLQSKQYFKQGQSLYSPGGTKMTLMPRGELCITHATGTTPRCLPSAKAGRDIPYHAILQSDNKLCVVEGEDPRKSGSVLRCLSALTSEKCQRPTLRFTDEGIIDMMCS